MSTPRLPDCWRRLAWVRPLGGWVWSLVLGLVFCLFLGPAFGQSLNQAQAQAQAPDAERSQLLAQQAELSARFDAQEQACRARFVVSACIEGVQQRRREALAPLREKLLQLDEAERLRRGAARQQSLADKARLRAERMEAAQAAATAASSASAPRTRQRMLPPASRLDESPNAPGRDDEAARREADAAERVRQAQRRQALAAERQARVERRLAEREAQKRPVQPLPADGSASAPR